MVRQKVVIIDDEMDLCHLLKTYLTERNYEVHMAHTLTSGLVLLSEITPDILFIDNNLPDGLGWENLQYFKEQFPRCKINLISAYQSVPKEISDTKRVRVIEKPLSLSSIKDFL
jgi:two-component system, OmpR family, response regulator